MTEGVCGGPGGERGGRDGGSKGNVYVFMPVFSRFYRADAVNKEDSKRDRGEEEEVEEEGLCKERK